MPRLRISLPFVIAVFVVAALPAALQARSSSSSETISVTVGVPHELSFHLSPSRITAATAIFKVMNKGKLHHSFKICTRPSATDKANSCTGVATKALAPGATAEVTVKLSASGTYEYLSGTPSQAASGMKGLLTVTLASTAPSGSAGSGATRPRLRPRLRPRRAAAVARVETAVWSTARRLTLRARRGLSSQSARVPVMKTTTTRAASQPTVTAASEKG